MKDSKYFKQEEFACKCGCGYDSIDILLVEELDSIREHYGVPITVTSGCRCEKHNAAVGGREYSRHLLGLAADIIVEGVGAEDVHGYLINRYTDRFGIGRYNSFTHFDVRDKAARW